MQSEQHTHVPPTSSVAGEEESGRRADAEPPQERPKWRVAITGSSGMIGSALAAALAREGHRVSRIVRSRRGVGAGGVGTDGAIYWDPATRLLDARHLEGFDAFVHLAGESIGERWTSEQKREIKRSRVEGTRLLANAIAQLSRPPRALVSASAVGIYGDRGDETLDESSSPGTDFLAEVAREWEANTEAARRVGVRVVNTRLGLVLSPRGGVLARMLLPFKLGVGGRIGDGRQWMSWVALHDALRAISFALATDALAGPVNVVAPKPVTNAEFTKTLARVLGRPSFTTVPAFVVRTVFGEMGDALLLGSQRVLPRRLEAAGFEFRHPDLDRALRFELRL